MSEQAIRLTQYSHGAGCGCKISPKVLETILHSEQAKFVDPNLLVGNETSDDAAVYDLGNGTSIVSTTDFFMPIVDNPFDFGRIAATNAISDIFAMGGKPIMAIAILGWPINTLAPEIAREVVEGGRFACQQAGIALAGGHSIDAPEPIFGLAVTGVVPTERIKKNSTAQAGCKLYLTKPLGIGVLTTAEKKSLLKPEHQGLATETMCQINLAGAAFAAIDGVKAMTDVTGFGLLGLGGNLYFSGLLGLVAQKGLFHCRPLFELSFFEGDGALSRKFRDEARLLGLGGLHLLDGPLVRLDFFICHGLHRGHASRDGALLHFCNLSLRLLGLGDLGIIAECFTDGCLDG